MDLIRREVAAFVAHANTCGDGPVAAAAMEGGSFRSVHRGFDLGAVFGVLQADLYALGLDPAVVAPVLVKKFATGRAHAEKLDVVNAVKKLWQAAPADDNQADAIVLAQIARALFSPAPAYTRAQAEVLHTLRAVPAPRGARVRIRTNLVNV